MIAAEAAAGLPEVTYVTLPEIEIARVGMKWPAASGSVTLTLQHLADAVTAANDDPFVLAPRLKLGHLDSRFNEDEITWDPFAYHGQLREDGSPAYGKVANLRLTNDGAVLVGDYVEVPNWLANAAPSAYPSRSQEADWDVVTPGGKRYSMVVTAVAMLGDRLPAIATLEDLIRLLTTGFDPAVEQQPVTARRNDMPVAAAADIDQVVHQCWSDFCVAERLWWWPCSIWVDPNQVICDDDEGHLYRVPFTTDENGNATFGDPIRVVQQFRDVPASDREPAVAASRPVATFASAADAGRPTDRVRAATTTEGAHMAIAPQAILDRLGLAEDATEEQMLAALDAEEATRETTTEETEVDEPAAATEPVAASAIAVDRDQLARLQADAKMGREAREAQIAAAREHVVDEAIRMGKFAPARRDHYLSLMTADEEGTRTLLASLADDVIPTKERGAAPVTAEAELTWFPQFSSPTRQKETV